MSLLHKNETITNSQPAKIKTLSVQSSYVLPSLSPYKQLSVLKDRLELFVLLNWTYTLTKVLAAKLPQNLWQSLKSMFTNSNYLNLEEKKNRCSKEKDWEKLFSGI